MIQQFLKKESSGLIDIKIPCVKLLPQFKKLYYSNQFARHVGNGQKNWQTIDSALHRKPTKSTPESISINSKLCTNKKKK